MANHVDVDVTMRKQCNRDNSLQEIVDRVCIFFGFGTLMEEQLSGRENSATVIVSKVFHK